MAIDDLLGLEPSRRTERSLGAFAGYGVGGDSLFVHLELGLSHKPRPVEARRVGTSGLQIPCAIDHTNDFSSREFPAQPGHPRRSQSHGEWLRRGGKEGSEGD
ncbi:hypothetical protein KM043_012014 [Ampulex compressa]|nr:hypothetical protein KM043_012014 [Ampulex compressa]